MACQSPASRLKGEVAELLETLLQLHAAHTVPAIERGDDEVGGFREAAIAQLPLLLNAYGAYAPWTCLS